MKAILLSSRTYTKKSTGEVGSTGTIVYLRPTGDIETKQIFGFNTELHEADSIVNVEFDPNGFLMSIEHLGCSNVIPAILDVLS